LNWSRTQKGHCGLAPTPSGLHRFDPATGQFTKYEHDINLAGTLSDNRVNSVYFDHSGRMWVGTQNGLNKLEPKTGTFTVYTQHDGLSGNAVGCIREDDHGALWMSTNNGVSKFDPQRTMFQSYSTADGLPGADLTGWGACFKSAAGEMFFAGFSGATAFLPHEVTESVYVPPIVLTNFRLSGRPVDIGGSSPLKKSITDANGLTLSHRQNMFSLEFSALSYSNPATNRYRYKLEGLDSDWHEVGSEQRLVNYTTLPAGIYGFRVQGATNRGPWSEPGVSLKIEVLPPWWSTWWFRTTCAALLLLLAFAAYTYRLHEITRQFEFFWRNASVSGLGSLASCMTRFCKVFRASQAVHDLLPRRSAEAIQLLDNVLDRGDQAIAEGRDAVQDLRSSGVIDSDLIQRLTVLAEDLAAPREN
jgi:hypothetical protein